MPKRKGTPVICAHCDRSVGYLYGDMLVIYSRHDGEYHCNTFTAKHLEALVAAQHEWFCKGQEVYHHCRPLGQGHPATYLSDAKWRCPDCKAVWDVMKHRTIKADD